MSVCDRLREERERLGMTQVVFSEIAGVKKLAQVKYEKGERSPDSDYMQRIAGAGVDVGYVFTGIRTIRRPGMDQPEIDLFNEMVDTFWNLSDDNRAHVLKTAKTLVNYERRKHKDTHGINKIDPSKTKGE